MRLAVVHAACVQVAGITVQDELEDNQKLRDAHKKAAEAQAAKEQQEAQRRRQKKATDGELLGWLMVAGGGLLMGC